MSNFDGAFLSRTLENRLSGVEIIYVYTTAGITQTHPMISEKTKHPTTKKIRSPSSQAVHERSAQRTKQRPTSATQVAEQMLGQTSRTQGIVTAAGQRQGQRHS